MKVFGKEITFSWIKDNLSVIILVPTILGGLWQLLELAIIGMPYIRFFSVTQLIPDGLLILVILSIFIPFIRFVKTNWSKFKNAQEEEDKGEKTGKLAGIGFSVLLLLPVILITLLFLDAFEKLTASPKSFVFLIFTIAFGLFILFWTGLFIYTLLRVFGRKINMEHPFTKRAIDIITPILLIGGIGLGGYLLHAFHDSFLFSENLRNVERLKAKINHSKTAADSSVRIEPTDKKGQPFEIIYFNDKYLFIKTVEYRAECDVKAYIEVLKFEDLLSDEASKKITSP